jgi:cytochrome b subunit of formate dehydrogenase
VALFTVISFLFAVVSGIALFFSGLHHPALDFLFGLSVASFLAGLTSLLARRGRIMFRGAGRRPEQDE